MTVVETSTSSSPRTKRGHDRLLFSRPQPAVQQPDAQIGEDFSAQPFGFRNRAGERGLAFVDRRRNDVGLMSARDVLAHELVDASPAGSIAPRRLRSACVPVAARR